MNLQNQFIIAMPSLQGPIFERSVTYICEHDEQGAMGIVINVPIKLSINEMFKQIDIDTSKRDMKALASKAVFQGGPVSEERGFVLHTPKPDLGSSIRLSDQLMLTSSKDILETLGTKEQPPQFLVALGYAGWEAGQLEQEIADNSWLTVPADLDIMFNTPISERWQKATQKLGIDVWQLSSDAGHA